LIWNIIHPVSSGFTLIWQLIVLSACCTGAGLALRGLIPAQFPPLPRALFLMLGGLFLVVLIPQNLVYLGVPVRISAWLLLGGAFWQIWVCRHKFLALRSTFHANADLRTLAVVIFLVITFHGFVPIRQGLEWYYGKGHFDQINYVLLAEFLKEEPYGTSQQEIGLRPWLLGPVGFHDPVEQLSAASGPGLETIGLKNERIGQSIVTAEISAWSGIDGKAGYAATVLFFLMLLAICVYLFLRETGINSWMAGSGALLAALLPAVTRLSLDGFLSQTSILFVFPFFVSLLRHGDLSARCFTLFFSLTLAYVVAAYSEMAPIGCCIFFLGVILVRCDKFRVKRLMLMGAILLIALVNPYYLRNLIGFLGYQYSLAANASALWDNVAPNVFALRGWSEMIFGAFVNVPLAFVLDGCALLLGLLVLAGAILLSRRDRLIFGVILLPAILVMVFLSTRIPFSYYPVAKITLTLLPFLIGLVFVALSRVASHHRPRPLGILITLLGATIVVAAATGSFRYYSEVLGNEDLLAVFREPRFLAVCRQLEQMKNQRVFVFETHPLLAAWLCYHARHNDVYLDGRLISDSPVPPGLPFSKIPDLNNLDFVATRDQIVDLRSGSVFYLTAVDDAAGEDWTHGQVRYRLGPPARLRFLASRPISVNVKMRLAPAPGAAAFPIDFFLTDAQGHVAHGQLWSQNVEVLPMNLPKGLSYLELSVKPKETDGNGVSSFPFVVELEGVKLSDIESNKGG
jgi:hypothetical protein